jgi:hypothetical protein
MIDTTGLPSSLVKWYTVEAIHDSPNLPMPSSCSQPHESRCCDNNYIRFDLTENIIALVAQLVARMLNKP